MTIAYRDIVAGLRDLGLGSGGKAIVHASLSALGKVRGGPDAAVGALLTTFESVLVPAFTYRTMLIPAVGPSNNAIEYGSADERNRMAEFFHADMPVDPAMGIIPETLRRNEMAQRSSHPILSFAGVNVEPGLEAQTLEEPLAPIRWLADQDGDVLLMGVTHRSNTSLHYAESLAGRKGFVRWALTPNGTVTCPDFPGCSEGFQAIAPRLDGVARRATIGGAHIVAVPLRDLVNIATGWVREDPEAMLCREPSCERCTSVRARQGATREHSEC